MIIDTEKEEQVLLDYSKITARPKEIIISHYIFNTLDGNVNVYETAESYPSIGTLFLSLFTSMTTPALKTTRPSGICRPSVRFFRRLNGV